MKNLRIMSAFAALLMLLIATPAIATDDDTDDTDVDETTVEEDTGSGSDLIFEDEVNLTSCDNLSGLDRASCRVKIQLKEKNEWEEGDPYCEPGVKQTTMQRAYCMITRNQQKKNAKGEKSTLSRAHQKARRYEYTNGIQLRRQEFKKEVKDTRQQFRANVKEARKGVSRTINNKIDVLKTKRQELRDRMNEVTKEIRAKKAREEVAKKITVREGKNIRERREKLMRGSADDADMKMRTRVEQKTTRRSGDIEERRTRVREPVNSSRVSE